MSVCIKNKFNLKKGKQNVIFNNNNLYPRDPFDEMLLLKQ